MEREAASAKVACSSCGSEIAHFARLCPVCRCYTKQWKNSLTYFGSMVGVITIVASGATFMAGQAAGWYNRLTWSDKVEAVYFEYPGYSGFMNTGSGDVVLELIIIEWPGERDRSIAVPVNQPVRRGEFVVFEAKSPFGKPQNDNTGVWAASPDGKATAKLLESAIDLGKSDRCAEYHFHNASHPVFERIAALQTKGKLIAVPATVHLNFISLYTGQQLSSEMPNMQTAFLYFPDNTDCKAGP